MEGDIDTCRGHGVPEPRRISWFEEHVRKAEDVNESRELTQTCSIIKSGSSYGIHLIKEDQAGFLGPCHLEELPHHPCALADVLLHQLTADDANEASVGPVCHGPSQQGLACMTWMKDAHYIFWRGLLSESSAAESKLPNK